VSCFIVAILIRRQSQERLGINAQASLPQGAAPRCDLGSPSTTCYVLFFLTRSHWQPCCCFASLHFVPSFGPRALDSFITLSSLWYRAIWGYSTSVSTLRELEKVQTNGSTVRHARLSMTSDGLQSSFSCPTIHPCYRSLPRECSCVAR
jgi:hypothetical protein